MGRLKAGICEWLGVQLTGPTRPYQFGFGAGARHLQRMGLPQWIAPALGGTEIVAAILFLVPKLDRIAGYSLLLIFAVAAAPPNLHGQFEKGAMPVYGAAGFIFRPPKHPILIGSTSG